MNVKVSKPTIGALVLSCLLALAGAAAAEAEHGGLLGDRDDLVRYLNKHYSARGGILTGACRLVDDSGHNETSWLYVILPRSGKHGVFVDLIAEPPHPPAWANAGTLYVLKRSVAIDDQMQGGAGLNAVYEGAGWWILQHHPKVVATFAQAVAKPPTLRCPDETTMSEWRFGHRRRHTGRHRLHRTVG